MTKPIGDPKEEKFFPKLGNNTEFPLKSFKDVRVHVAIALDQQTALPFIFNELKRLGGEFVTHDMAVMPPSPLSPNSQPQVFKVLLYLFDPETVKEITGDGYNSKTMYDIRRFVKF